MGGAAWWTIVVVALLTLSDVGCRGGGGEPVTGASEPLPGALPRTPEVATRLRAAVSERGASYRPRTRHLTPDGDARYTNRLILEHSPYLLQHAHNPVDWYSWGEEAFARARAEHKPILLSVGYATCHWCHVMEVESFEDEEVAAHLNAEYVAIKVDREERPDVDETYINTVMLLTGGAGWPMTVWMTPEREVFFAGTYFPARDGDRGARTGFLTLLRRFAASYRADPGAAAREGRALAARLRALADVAPAAELPGSASLHAAFARYQATFDRQHGGFGRAPKFPMPAVLDFLLRYHRRTRDPAALVMVEQTLDGLAAGGIRDQLGGGFHRYSTDAAWRIPHFEKMLYDNAQLASVYLGAAQATGRDELATVASDVLDDLERTLRAPGGAFYSARDADDPAGEGGYYAWTAAEIDVQLDVPHASAFRALYGVTDEGNFEGKTILHAARSRAEVASLLGIDPEQVGRLVDEARQTLLEIRHGRPAPLVDTKILTGWNGLAIGAFAQAGAVLRRTHYVDVAREAASFVLEHMRPRGRLARVHAGGVASQPAFLEDYAFLAAGLLDLYDATFDRRWLHEAERLHAVLAEEFWDPAGGGFFASGADRDPDLPRTKPADDGALPSGNAVAADNLVRLAALTDDEGARRRAVECVRALGRGVEAAPTSAPRLLGVLESLLEPSREIVIVESGAGDPDGRAALLAVVRRRFLPNRALLVARDGAELTAAQADLPFAAEKLALDGRTTGYVCERGRCRLPTADPALFAAQLAETHPLPPSLPMGD